MFARHGHAVAAQCYVMILSAEEWGEFSPRSENLEESEREPGRGEQAKRCATARGGRCTAQEKKRRAVVRSGRKANGR